MTQIKVFMTWTSCGPLFFHPSYRHFCSFFKSDYFFSILQSTIFLFFFHFLIGTLYRILWSILYILLNIGKMILIKILQPCIVLNDLDDNQIGCYDYFATIISSYVAIHVRCSLMNMICVAIQQHIEAWSTFDVNLY